MKKRGFTLIELLVVIAIIGILATLVITQLAGAQVRARNSSAKSDITEAGKSIETWKTTQNIDNVFNGVAPSAANTASTTLTASANAGGFTTLFSNTAAVVGTSYAGYPLVLGKTPGSKEVYSYVTSTVQGVPALTIASAGSVSYCIATSVESGGTVTDTTFIINDGTSKSGAAATPAFLAAPPTSNICN